MKRPDYAALRRAIHGGVAEAARDAGLSCFMLHVEVKELPVAGGEISVVVIELTPEEADRLRAAQEAEARARESGN